MGVKSTAWTELTREQVLALPQAKLLCDHGQVNSTSLSLSYQENGEDRTDLRGQRGSKRAHPQGKFTF